MVMGLENISKLSLIPMGTVAVIILVIFLRLNSLMSTKYNLEMQRVEQTTGKDVVDITNLRVKKYNRTVAVIDGTFRIVKDLGESYEYRLTVANSPLGNNQFNEYPMKIPQTKGCDAINVRYREYQQYFANGTNLPMVTDEGLCPFPKGDYWARNWVLSPDWVPAMVPEGYWRTSFDIINSEGVIVCQIRSYLRLTRIMV